MYTQNEPEIAPWEEVGSVNKNSIRSHTVYGTLPTRRIKFARLSVDGHWTVPGGHGDHDSNRHHQHQSRAVSTIPCAESIQPGSNQR